LGGHGADPLFVGGARRLKLLPELGQARGFFFFGRGLGLPDDAIDLSDGGLAGVLDGQPGFAAGRIGQAGRLGLGPGDNGSRPAFDL
jgi:hypothetical protein